MYTQQASCRLVSLTPEPVRTSGLSTHTQNPAYHASHRQHSHTGQPFPHQEGVIRRYRPENQRNTASWRSTFRGNPGSCVNCPVYARVSSVAGAYKSAHSEHTRVAKFINQCAQARNRKHTQVHTRVCTQGLRPRANALPSLWKPLPVEKEIKSPMWPSRHMWPLTLWPSQAAAIRRLGSAAQRGLNISREILLHRKSLLRLRACQGIITH